MGLCLSCCTPSAQRREWTKHEFKVSTDAYTTSRFFSTPEETNEFPRIKDHWKSHNIIKVSGESYRIELIGGDDKKYTVEIT